MYMDLYKMLLLYHSLGLEPPLRSLSSDMVPCVPFRSSKTAHDPLDLL